MTVATPTRCERCGKPSDAWPGDKGGELCQMCWEDQCNDAWWGMVKQLHIAECKSRSRMRGGGRILLAYETRAWIAAFLRAAGVRYGCSTFIDGETVTRGYGHLDEFGSWEFPL